MWKGKQTQQPPPHKRRKKQKKDQTHNQQQVAINNKCISIETQLRLQREKAAIIHSQQIEKESAADSAHQSEGLRTVKGYVYDTEKQRYFKRNDRKTANKSAPGFLPKSLNKCTLSLSPPPPPVNHFSLVPSLLRRQLGGKSKMDYSSLLARSIRLQDSGTAAASVKSVHFHPLFGKLLTLQESLLFLHTHLDSVCMRYVASSPDLAFVTAKWAPSPTPLVGAVLCDPHRGVYRVVVLHPPVSVSVSSSSPPPPVDQWGEGGGLVSTTVLELKTASVSNIQWASKPQPNKARASKLQTNKAEHEQGQGHELELVVCSEDAVISIAWPACHATRLCAVASPAVCFAPLSACSACSAGQRAPCCACGLVGLRNGSILMVHSPGHTACRGGGRGGASSGGRDGGRGGGSSRGSRSDHHDRPSPVLLARMPHCLDHLHPLHGGRAVLAQDIVGNLRLVDLLSRRPGHRAVDIVHTPRAACSQLLQGSLFWVSPDERMVLVNGRSLECSQGSPDEHARAIDVWSLAAPFCRLHQVAVCNGRGAAAREGEEGACARRAGGGGAINTVRFAPNIDLAACLLPCRVTDSSTSGSYSDSGSYSGGSYSSDSYSGDSGGGGGEWQGAAVVCLRRGVGGAVEASLLDVCSSG
jgi:hypothetical protein